MSPAPTCDPSTGTRPWPRCSSDLLLAQTLHTDSLPVFFPPKSQIYFKRQFIFQFLILKENGCCGSKAPAAMHAAGWGRGVGTEKLRKTHLQKFTAGRTEAAAPARSSILPCTLL